MKQKTKLAVVFLADGVEEMEAVIVLDVLRRGGLEVQGMAIADHLTVNGAHKIEILADCLLDETLLGSADLLVVPGGMRATLALCADARVLEQLQRANRDERQIAAICAGPMVLASAGLLQGRKVTCYPGLEDKLPGAVLSETRVVRDGNLTTSRAPGTAAEFALTLVQGLMGTVVADEVAADLLVDLPTRGGAL